MRSAQWHNNRTLYGSVSRLLHWLIAVLILVMFCLGWSIDLVPKEWKSGAIGVHKSLGIIILALAIVRLVWRFYNPPPPFPNEMHRWEKMAAVSIHWLLYGFLFALPLTGWAMTSAKDRPIMFLGMVQLPDFVSADRPLGKLLEEIHGDLAYILAAVIILHASAALYHHFIGKDGVLMRMWPITLKK